MSKKAIKPFYVYLFYAIGNGGMKCYSEYRIFSSDPLAHGKDHMEDLTDSILGGNYPSGVRSLHYEYISKPSKEILTSLLEDLQFDIRRAKEKIMGKIALVSHLTEALK